jgi:hypothetical protein
MGEYLMMYEGLVLYMKEMDEDRYQRLCSVSPPMAVIGGELTNRITWLLSVNSINPR